MNYNTDGEEILIFEVNSLYGRLGRLRDQRHRRGIRYPMAVVMTMIILAKLAGEDEPHGMAVWLKERAEEICRLLCFGRKQTPAASTIGRIVGQAVEVSQLDEMIGGFLTSGGREQAAGVAGQKQYWLVVTLDGKTLRGTIPAGQTQGLHLLAAYLPGEGIVLMQVAVDSKENEISAAPRLLEMIDLRGKVVTADALNSQRALSAQIVAAGGDYLFIVKDNQPNTRAAIQQLFTEPAMRPGFHAIATDFKTATTQNKGHGRLERRTLTASSMLNDYLDWPYVGQVFRIHRQVTSLATGEIKEETVFGLTSLTAQQASPADLLAINRSYWAIENGLHHRRDVTFHEDASSVRSWRAQHVLAALNNLVLGLILHNKVYPSVPDERRRYCARPQLALPLLTRSFSHMTLK